MRCFKREIYLRKIRGFYDDTDLIKVVTGVRRCGKSSLMSTIADELRDRGVDQAHVVFLDLDRRPYRNVKTPDRLESLIAEKSPPSGTTYLFIDEVQNVKGFEEVVNAFRTEGRHSIFLTGSNSYLLSGELVTKLTGRYVEFEMFPLTFDEWLGMKSFFGKPVSASATEEFDRFLRDGGFPKAVQYDNPEDRRAYVRSVVAEILEKDVRRRAKVRHVDAFRRVQTYLVNNFGARTSLPNILEALEKSGTRMKLDTLERYVRILVDAKVLCECERFDLKSRRSIRGERKYYLSDLGFYFAAGTDNRVNYGPALENAVYVYARSRGCAASVGRIGPLECNFILRRGEEGYAYAQVCMTMMASRETEDREYAPLEAIRDNYPKYVLTRNDPIQSRNGILHRNLPEFMRDGEVF